MANVDTRSIDGGFLALESTCRLGSFGCALGRAVVLAIGLMELVSRRHVTCNTQGRISA